MTWKAAALLAFAALLSTWTVAAQQPSDPAPTPVIPAGQHGFQTVRVDNFKYQVDPYYPCAFNITSRVTKLTSDEEGAVGPISSTVTFQGFVRIGDQMVPIDAFATFDSAITVDTKVGSWFICVPQVAMEQSNE